MAGLILKLAANERVLLNGMVIENGPKKTTMTIHSEGASVLRLRDAIHPDALGGPVSIAYYYAQLAVAGETSPEEALEELRKRLEELRHVFEGTESLKAVEDAHIALDDQNFYKTMRSLAPLMSVEKNLLGRTVQ